jgi:predicted  nucleic acid-binding Zn-ribbon protein
MIVLMEETEVLDQKARAGDRQAAEVQTDHEQKVRLLESELAELTAAIDVRRVEREQIVQSLPPDLVKRYERVRSSKAGIAVAPIRKERCSGCLSPIPAQRILEIDREDRVYICEACGRILVVARD